MRYGSISTLVIFITLAEVQNVSLRLMRVVWIFYQMRFENTIHKCRLGRRTQFVFHLQSFFLFLYRRLLLIYTRVLIDVKSTLSNFKGLVKI